MQKVEVSSQISLSDLLNSVGQLNTKDLEQFISQVLTMRAKRVAPNVSNQEAEMLEKINRGLQLETQQRYNVLVTKRLAETLTSEEHQELLTLIDTIELADAERVQTLTKLAQLRNVSVTTLMKKLNIRPPVYG